MLPHPLRPPVDALVELRSLPVNTHPESYKRAFCGWIELMRLREGNAGSVVKLQCPQDAAGIPVRIACCQHRVYTLELRVESLAPFAFQAVL